MSGGFRICATRTEEVGLSCTCLIQMLSCQYVHILFRNQCVTTVVTQTDNDTFLRFLLHLHVSCNHRGRKGITADIGDNLLPSLTVLGRSPTAVEVFDSILIYFSLPSPFPDAVPCKIGYRWHLMLPFVTVVKSSSLAPIYACIYCALHNWWCGLCTQFAKGPVAPLFHYHCMCMLRFRKFQIKVPQKLT